MRVTVHQPHYMPWLGYFDKMDKVDRFVFLDTVQFEKGGWQNRNRIKAPSGAQWLTVPVHAPLGTLLSDVQIAGQGWRTKHLHALTTCYSGAPFFRDYRALLEGTLAEREWRSLVELCIYATTSLSRELGIHTERIRASSLGIVESDPNVRLVRICQVLGAKTYLAGTGGKAYVDVGLFEDHGIEVEFQDFGHPVYSQLFGAFVGNLSVIDLLFNCGARSLEMIRNGGKALPVIKDCPVCLTEGFIEGAGPETPAQEEERL